MSKLISPIGRVSYPSLYKPNKADDTGKENFQVTLLFDKGADLQLLKDAANKAMTEKWGAKLPKGIRSPFRDGDEKDQPEYQGKTFVTFKTSIERKPGVVGPDAQPLDPSQMYAGCHARVSFGAFAWEHKTGGVGVSFSLNNVQKMRDDTRFDGRTDAEDDFEAIVSEDEPAF